MMTPDYAAVRAEIRGTLRALEEMFTANLLDAVVSTQSLLAFSLTACPALTLPVGIDETLGLPVPLILLGLPFTEARLFSIAAALENAIGMDFLPPLNEA
jgi:Asp-tRNA(Asn)/Glu-tRNA(Gln) amidotransferase A subunit family amidase